MQTPSLKMWHEQTLCAQLTRSLVLIAALQQSWKVVLKYVLKRKVWSHLHFIGESWEQYNMQVLSKLLKALERAKPVLHHDSTCLLNNFDVALELSGV